MRQICIPIVRFLQDGGHTCDGSPFSTSAAAVCATLPHTSLLAVGVNCTAPEDAARLLGAVDGRRVTVPMVVYPNSGEQWVDGR